MELKTSPALVLGLPFQGRPVRPEWTLSMMMQNYPLCTNLNVVPTWGEEIGAARNRIVEAARTTTAKYLWFVDDDTAPPIYAARKLIFEMEQRSDVMVCGGIYCAKTDPPQPLVFKGNGQGCFWDWTCGDIFECDGLGTGCMMIRLSVFDHLGPPPWFKTVDEHSDDTLNFIKQQTDDLYFCEKVRAAGHKILAHGGVLPIHWDNQKAKAYILPESSLPVQRYLKTQAGQAEAVQAAQDLGLTVTGATHKSINTEIPGWMTPEELLWLHDTASRFQSIVEIGSWMGRSTHSLLSGCPGTVWAIDHFKGTPSELNTTHTEAKTKDIYANFMSNVGSFSNLKVLKMDSVKAAKKFKKQSVEMVFIDGDHSYNAVLADLQTWLPKCSKLLCGHDRNMPEIEAALKTMRLEWKLGPGLLWYVDIKAQN